MKRPSVKWQLQCCFETELSSRDLEQVSKYKAGRIPHKTWNSVPCRVRVMHNSTLTLVKSYSSNFPSWSHPSVSTCLCGSGFTKRGGTVPCPPPAPGATCTDQTNTSLLSLSARSTPGCRSASPAAACIRNSKSKTTAASTLQLLCISLA